MMAVILAGGQGSRLWPLSRRDRPKQFCSLLGHETMIAQCYQRLRKILEPQDIFVSLLPEFVDVARACLPQLKREQLIVEPSRRDSGPAMAYAALSLKRTGRGNEPVLFIPTDHFIENEESFLDHLRLGASLVRETGKLIDIGVTPQFASTELGYTKVGKRIDTRNNIEVYEFQGHKEKPSRELAQQYIASGEYLWHANYYMWTPDALLQAFAQHAPEIYEPLQCDEYATLPKISMDYAVTEKLSPQHVLILKGDFGWSDVGAWNVLGDMLGKDKRIHSKHVALDSKNCFVHSSTDKLIATIGVQDLVIVETPDALLICPRDRAQEVKQLVDHLGTTDLKQYL